MIGRITGTVECFNARGVELRVGPLVLEVLLTEGQLQALRHVPPGEALELFTIFYLEGQVGTGSLVPTLIGFASAEDREFFRLFTTVKNIGPGKALRALSRSTGELARAIEENDVRLLAGLKGIGEKTARQIVVELAGKVAPFAREGGNAESEVEAEALEILLQLGYGPAEARRMVREARETAGQVASAAELIELVFQRGRDGTA